MARIEAYRAGDWEKIEPRELELEGLKYTPNLDHYVLQGPAFTIYDRDIPVMCGGVRIRPDKIGEPWIFCSKWIERHIMAARFCKDFMEAIAKDWNLPSLQVVVNSNYPKTLHWLEWLGFHFERSIPEYAGWHMYRRIMWQ